MADCNECGANVGPAEQFCGNCGAQQHPASRELGSVSGAGAAAGVSVMEPPGGAAAEDFSESSADIHADALEGAE
ncbi:MAG TPA: hypothetical protein VI750_14090, partial [Pyrinomonadaceae bacterium]|nr:hypothetical protein [Pyrinomonadaceae bacterium]